MKLTSSFYSDVAKIVVKILVVEFYFFLYNCFYVNVRPASLNFALYYHYIVVHFSPHLPDARHVSLCTQSFILHSISICSVICFPEKPKGCVAAALNAEYNGDAFIPECSKTNDYQRKQCNNDFCYCVAKLSGERKYENVKIKINSQIKYGCSCKCECSKKLPYAITKSMGNDR